jgi:pescadillo protein
MHDPLIPMFRAFKVWRAKLAKAKAKKDYDRVKILRTTRPKYRLDHLIRERYPSFPDALKDLDDCLSLVSLFASLPQSKMLKAKRIAFCAQLCREFQYYMILTRSLKKAFISIKGYYFQGEVLGQTVTWLVPHNFTPKVPSDVDINVMLTFLELYETLLGFVNFRLFQSIGLRYPPVIDYSKLKENEFYASLRFERENTNEIDEAEKATHEEMKEVFTEFSDAIQPSSHKSPEDLKKLFSGF